MSLEQGRTWFLAAMNAHIRAMKTDATSVDDWRCCVQDCEDVLAGKWNLTFALLQRARGKPSPTAVI